VNDIGLPDSLISNECRKSIQNSNKRE